MLGSKFPMFVAWGPQLGFLYNDPYAAILGTKHPSALGAPFRDIWAEIWPDISPLIDAAMAGEASYREDLPLLMNRSGYQEQTWFTFSYSPLRDESGAVSGMFCTCTETTGKVQAEDRLRTASQRQQRLFQRAPGFITILTGPDHVFEFVNDAYARLFGSRDYIGRSAREVFPELSGQGFFELLDQVYTSGERFVAQHVPIRLRGGSGAEEVERFLDFIYEPIIDENNQVTGIFCEGHDVTEARLAELEARENAARLRALTDNLPSGMVYQIATGPEGVGRRFLYVSQSHEKLTGIAAEAVLADPSVAYKLILPEYRVVLAEAEAEAIRGRKPLDVQVQFRRIDGEIRWCRIISAPRPQPDGSLIWDGIQIDITDQKLAETMLRGLNEELQHDVAQRTAERDRIWRLSHDLLAVAGFDGRLRAINPAWSRTLGFDDATLLSMPFAELIHPDDLAAAAEVIKFMAQGQRTERFEDRLRTATGEYRTISWTAVPEGDRFYAIGRDVTERLEVEEQLRQAQKMEAIGQLTGGIAHDFNNLLAGIVGSLDLMQTRITQGRTDSIERYARAAMSSAQRAAALTHRLLAFARRQPLDPRPVNANQLIASMEDLLRRTIGPLHELELVMAGGLWTTLCDPHQLESAILNLAINARDAMPEGGKLTIETGNAHLDDAYAAAEREVTPGQYVAICVTDTGTGMPLNVTARAVEPFFTTKPLGQGTGLGLSMVYGFAKQSEGHLKIYSELGKGTTIKIYLPRHLGDGQPVEDQFGSLSEAPRAEPGETVLVVEDEPVIRDLILDVLQDLGYQAIEAADGVAGLRHLLSNSRIDLVVTDVGLPGLNGRQLADQAREQRPDLKILFITGYAENATIANGFLEPGMEMMTKPFSVEGLARRIRTMIEGSKI